MSNIRKLPEQKERVETGPVKFGEDWTGVYIRGDNAIVGYGACLKMAEELLKVIVDKDNILDVIALKGVTDLIELLESCNENGDQHDD